VKGIRLSIDVHIDAHPESGGELICWLDTHNTAVVDTNNLEQIKKAYISTLYEVVDTINNIGGNHNVKAN